MKGKPITFRPKKDLRERLELLARSTERPISYFIEKAIEAHLPALEQKHAEELGTAKKTTSVRYELNERMNKKAAS